MLKGCKLNECDQTWESLKAIDSKTSYCERCKETVYKADGAAEIQEHLKAGHCIAIDYTLGMLIDPKYKE